MLQIFVTFGKIGTSSKDVGAGNRVIHTSGHMFIIQSSSQRTELCLLDEELSK
jgi:hypothetical protein